MNKATQTSKAKKKFFPSFTVKLSGGKSMTYTFRPRPVMHTLLATLLAGFYGNAFALNQNALPTGGVVAAGSASIAQSGAAMSITQTTQNAIINWNTFNIGSNASVNVAQPNSSSVQLDRVVTSNASQIFGKLTSNGSVFLINPNGVLFGSTAQVDVGSLVASTLDISDANFLSGNYTFSNSGSAGSVVNQGTINAAQGGYVALLGPQVSNQGVVAAKLGAVALAAGDQVTLDFNGDGLIKVAVDKGNVNALAENRGLIQAEGGMVYMGAKNAGDLAATVVNNTGIIEAQSVVNHNGTIVLEAQGGAAANSGTLDASAADATANGGTVKVLAMDSTADASSGSILARGGSAGGDGGFVEVSGNTVNLGGMVDTRAPMGNTGNFLIDPTYLTINSGGMVGSNYDNTQLAANLLTSNITVQSLTTLEVMAPVSWNSAYSLTLQAGTNLTVDSGITISNAYHGNGANGGLTMTAGGFIEMDGLIGLYNSPFSATATGYFTNLGGISTTGGSVTISAGGVATIGQAILGAGNVDITGSGIDLNANIDTRSGTVTFNDPVTLGSTVQIKSTDTGSGADITFGTVDGNYGLTVVAGSAGNVSMGAIGGSAALSSLNISSAKNVTLNNVGGASAGVTGNTSVTASGAMTFNGTTYNADQQTYNAASYSMLGGTTTTFSSNGHLLQFSTGAITTGAGGNLNINSTGGSVSTAAITLGTGGNLDIESAGGDITTGAVDGSVGGVSNVTLNANGGAGSKRVSTGNIGGSASGAYVGNVTITGDGGVQVGSISTDGGNVSLNSTGLTQLGGNIDTTAGGTVAGGNIGLTGNAQLNANVTMNTHSGAGDGSITLGGTVNAETAGTQSLALTSGAQDININFAVGGTRALNSFSATGGNVTVNAPITTSGASPNGISLTTEAGVLHPLTINAALSAGTGDILLSSDAITFAAPGVLPTAASGNTITLVPTTAGTNIEVGGAPAVVGDLNISSAMLGQISGTTTVIGNSSAGRVDVYGTVNDTTTTNITLTSGTDITNDQYNNTHGAGSGVGGYTVTAASGTITLNAVTGIGSPFVPTYDMATSAPTIVFSNTGSAVNNFVNIDNTTAAATPATLSGSNSSVGGDVNLTETGGDFQIGAGGISVAASATISIDAVGGNNITDMAGGVLTAITAGEAINLGLAGGTGSIGTSLKPILVNPGAAGVSAESTGTGAAGSIYLQQSSGDMALSNYTLSTTNGTTATAVSLATTNGAITVDNTGGFNVNTNGDAIYLTTNGAGAGSGNNINFTGATLTGDTATLNASGAITTTGGTPDISATTSVSLTAVNGIGASGNPITTTSPTVSFSNTGTTGDVYISDSSGSVSFSGSNSAAGGAVNLTESGLGNTLTVGGAISANDGAITLTADVLTLSSTVNADGTNQTGTITLAPYTTSHTIGLEDSTQNFNVTNAMLGQLTAGGGVTLGGAGQSGNISMLANNDVTTNLQLTLQTSGNINIDVNNVGGATTGSGNGLMAGTLTLDAGGYIANPNALDLYLMTNGNQGTGNLTLNAVTGIGNVGGSAPIKIGSVAGLLAADNTTSGDLYLQTGTIHLGGGAQSISLDHGTGVLEIDATNGATNDIYVDGTVSSGATGGITLKANRNIIFEQDTVTGVSAPGSTVTLTAGNSGTNGYIASNSTNGAVDVSADTLIASSLDGIGTLASPLQTSVNTINLQNSNNNDISINNTDTGSGLLSVSDPNNSVGYGAVNYATGGQISLTNNGGSIAINQSGGGAAGGVSADGTVTITANGTSSDISVLGAFCDCVTSDSGDVVLNAGRNVLLGNSGPVAVATNANILKVGNLQTGSIVINAGGNVTLDNDSGLTTGSGNITVTAGTNGGGTVSLQASLATGAWITSGSGSISITAETGNNQAGTINIGDGVPGDTQGISSNSGSVTLVADNMNFSDTVGGGTSSLITLMPYTAGTAIELGPDATVLGDKGTTGLLVLSQSDLNNISGSGGLTIGDSANTASITVLAGAAPGSGLDMTVSGASGLTGGTLSLLTAGGDINFNGVLTSPVSVLLDTTNNLNTDINGNFTVATGAITDNGSGGVRITDAYTTGPGVLAAYAATGIGSLSGSALRTQVDQMTLVNTTSGDIAVNNTDNGNSYLVVGQAYTNINAAGVSGNFGIVNLNSAGQVSLISNNSILVDTTSATGIAAYGTVTVTANGGSSDIVTWGSGTAIASDSGDVNLTAGGSVLVGYVGASYSNGGPVVATSGGYGDVATDYSVLNGSGTGSGSIYINAGGNVTVDDNSYVESGSGNVNVTAGGSVTVGNSGAWINSTNGGNINIYAQTGSITVDATANGIGGDSNSPNASNTYDVYLSANSMSLSGPVVGTDQVTLVPYTSGTAITLGGAGGLSLAQSDLGNIRAPNLLIGGTMTGDGGSNTGLITIAGAIDVSSNIVGGTVTLQNTTDGIAPLHGINISNNFTANQDLVLSTAGAIADTNASTLTTGNNLMLEAQTGIGSAGTPVLTAASGIYFNNGTSGDVNISNANASGVTVSGSNNGNSGADTTTITETAGAMTVDTVNSYSGIDGGTGAVVLNAKDGITVNQNVSATNNTITVNADTNNDGTGTLSVADGKSINTGGNTMTITAADLNLNTSGALTASGSTITINTTKNAANTALGSLGLGATAGDMTISGAELHNITDSTLNLNAAGGIVVDNITAANSANAGTVVLTATGAGNPSISFINHASTFKALTAQADAGLYINQNVTTNTGAMVLDGNYNTALQFNDDINVANGVTLTSATSITVGNAAHGGTYQAAGTSTLNAQNGVTFNIGGTAAGLLTVNADSDANGSGDFTTLSALNLNGGASITAHNVFIGAALNASGQTITINTTRNAANTAAGSLGLGATAGDMTISDATLGLITANTLTLNAGGGITVDQITAGNSANVGTVNLNATGGNVAFANHDSTFTGNVSATSTGGKVTFGAGRTLTSSAGSITLSGGDGTASAISGAGATTLSAYTGVTINSNMTSANTLTMTADSGNNGVGTLTVASGKTVKTTAGNIVINAADLDLQGSLSSAGTVGVTASNNGAIRVGDVTSATEQMQIDNGELSRISAAGGTTFTTTGGGDINVVGVTTGSTGTLGGWTLNAGTGGGGTGNLNIETSNSVVDGTSLTGTGTNVYVTAGLDMGSNHSLSLTANNGEVSVNGSGVVVQASDTALSTGDITLTSTSGAANWAVNVQGGAVVKTKGAGSISATGTSSASSNNIGVLVFNSGSAIKALGTGSVTLTGHAANPGTGSARGVDIEDNAVVSTNSGALTIVGTSAGSDNSSVTRVNAGIHINRSGQVLSTSGLITLDGTGGTGANNYGVLTNGGSYSGTVTIDGPAPVNGDILIISRGGTGIGLNDANISAPGANVTLEAIGGGPISQFAGPSDSGLGYIQSGALRILGSGAATTVSLGSIGNQISTLAANLAAGGTLSYTDGGAGFDIGSVTSIDHTGVPTTTNGINVGVALGDNVTLNAAGAVTQSQSLTANGLELAGGAGSFNLNDPLAGNSIVKLAGDVNGDIAYYQVGGFDIGTVNTIGLTSISGNITLSSGGAVTQSRAIAATNGGLALLGGGSYNLNDPTSLNSVATLAGNATGSIVYYQGSGFDIGTVTSFVTTAGLASGSYISLSSGGAVTQSQAITANTGGLELLGAGSYTLTDGSNSVNKLAGTVTGSVDFTNNGSFAVNIVNGSTGLTTSAADIQLVAESGTLTVTHAVTTGGTGNGATTYLVADNMAINSTVTSGTVVADTYTATRGIELGVGAHTAGTPTLQLDNTDLQHLQAATVRIGMTNAERGASGTVIASSDRSTGTINAFGAVDFTGNAASGSTVVQLYNNGDITLNNNVLTNGNLVLNANIDGGAPLGAVTGTGQLTVGTIAGTGSTGGGTLTVTANDGISLANVGNLAAFVTLANSGTGSISFDDNRNMTLGTSVTPGAGGVGATNSASGGNITVTNNTGTMDVTGVVQTLGNGNNGFIALSTPGLLTVDNKIQTGYDSGLNLSTGTGTISLTSTAGGGITNEWQIDGNGGVTINAKNGKFTNVSSGLWGGIGFRTQGNENVTIIADAVDLQTGGGHPSQIGGLEVDNRGHAAAGTVTIKPYTAGTLINVGGADAAGVPATLGLTNAELQTIDAGSIVIGGPSQGLGDAVTSGQITISAPIDLTAVAWGAPNLTLQNTTGGISVGGGVAVSGNLVLSTTGAIADATLLTAPYNTQVLAGNTVTLTATNGIGVSHSGAYDPIEVQPASSAGLTANNGAAGTGTGDIALVQPQNDLTVNGGGASITNTANNGAIDIATLGQASTTGNINIFGTVTTYGNGAVYINAGGTGSNIVMDSASLSLIQSGSGVWGGANPGTGTGVIDLTADTDIQLAQVMNSTASGTVNLIATNGSILDNNGNTNNVTSHTLNATALNYIGRVADHNVLLNPGAGLTVAGDAIETSIAALNAQVTRTTNGGEIAIDNTDLGAGITVGGGFGFGTTNGVQYSAWIRNTNGITVNSWQAGIWNDNTTTKGDNLGLTATAGDIVLPNAAINLGRDSSLGAGNGGTLRLEAANTSANGANMGGGLGQFDAITVENLLLKSGVSVNLQSGAAGLGGPIDVANADIQVGAGNATGATLTFVQNALGNDAQNAHSLTFTDLDGDGNSLTTQSGAVNVTQTHSNSDVTFDNNVDLNFGSHGLGASLTSKILSCQAFCFDPSASVAPTANNPGGGWGSSVADGSDNKGGNYILATGFVTTNSAQSAPFLGTLTVEGRYQNSGTLDVTNGESVLFVAPSADIVFVGNQTAAGNVTLIPGSSNDVVFRPGSSLTVTSAGTGTGSLVIQNADEVVVESGAGGTTPAAINVAGSMIVQDVYSFRMEPNTTVNVGTNSAVSGGDSFIATTGVGSFSMDPTASLTANGSVLIKADSTVVRSPAGTDLSGTWTASPNSAPAPLAGTVQIGNVTVDANGDGFISALIAPGVVSTTAGAARLAIESTGGSIDFTGTVTAGGGSTSAIVGYVGATSGSITSSGAGQNFTNFTGLELNAGTGIGSAGTPVNTGIATVAAHTGSGGAYIDESGSGSGLTIGSLSTFDVGGTVHNMSGITIGGGDGVITAASPLIVNAAVSDTGGGSITLAATGGTATDNLTLNANVTATGGTGSINLYGNSVTINNGVTVSAAGTGAVNVYGGYNYNDGVTILDGTAPGTVSMGTTAVVESQDGDIAIKAPGDITLSTVNANSNSDATVGSVTVDAGYTGPNGTLTSTGKIVNGLAAGALNITGNTITLNAVDGIGNGSAIDITGSTLAATNTGTSGNVNVASTGGLTVNALQQTNAANAAGTVTLVAATGDIGLNNGAVVSKGGLITLTATTGGITDADLGAVTSITNTNGAAVLTAATGIGAADAVETALTTITATSTNGNVYLANTSATAATATNLSTGTGNISLTQTGGGALTVTSATTANGTINLNNTGNTLTVTAAGTGTNNTLTVGTTTSGDVKLGLLQAGTGIVNVNSKGAIIDNNDTTAPLAYFNNIVAGTANLSAVNGIGVANGTGVASTYPLETQVANLSLINNGSGAIQVANNLNSAAGTLNITNISQTGGGAVVVSNNGGITLTSGGSGISADGAVTLNAATNAGDDVVISHGITMTGAGGALDILAGRDITVNNGAVLSTNNGNITLNSDAAAASTAGAILLTGASSLTSHGGNITLGGGLNAAGNAIGVTGVMNNGVALQGASINSGAGNITINGQGAATSGARGVLLDGSSGATSITSAGGAISITGHGGNSGGAGSAEVGVQIGYNGKGNASVTNTGNLGTVTITGTGGNGTGGQNAGVWLENSNGTATVSTTTGALDITGTAVTGSNSPGVVLSGVNAGNGGVNPGVVIKTTTGALNIAGTGSSGQFGILAGNLATSTISSTSGNILLEGLNGTGIGLNWGNLGPDISTAGSVTLNASGGGSITQSGGYIQSGGLRVLGDTTTTTATLTSTANHVGKLAANLAAGGTLNYVDSGAFTVDSVGPAWDGSANSTTNGINVGTAAGDIVTLSGGGTTPGTVGQNQAITAGGLDLLGADSYYLTSFSNNVSTLAANVTGGSSVSFYNAGALTIGTVNSTSGVTTAGGYIDVETNNGDLTVSQKVDTTANNTVTTGANIWLGAGQGGTASSLYINNTVNGGAGVPGNWVSVWADDNVAFGQAATGITTGGTAYVWADNSAAGTGAITGAGTGTDIVANVLEAYAAQGIGTSSRALSTKVSTINLENTTSGDIYVNNTDTGGGLTVADPQGFGYGIVNMASGGNVSLTNNGDIVLTTNVSAATGMVALNATAGNINQTGGTLTAGVLTGSATGTVSLMDANAVTNLDAFTSNGGFTLYDAGGLNVTGAVNDSSALVTIQNTAGDLSVTTGSVTGTGVSLTTLTSGNISLANNVTAGTGAATITSAGGISQTAGTVSGTGVTMTSHGGDVTLAGNVTAGTGAASITSSGAIDQTAGTISGTGVTMASQGGDVTLAGNVTAGTGAASITSSGAIDQTAGTVSGTGVTMTANGGDIAVGGSVNGGTGTATLTASGGITDATGNGTVTAVDVVLNGTTGVGSGSARVNTAAGTLDAHSAAGSVYVSQNGAVTLATLTTGNSAAVDYDLVSSGTITVGTGGVKSTSVATTDGVTLNATSGNVMLGTAAGTPNGQVTGENVTITAAGSILDGNDASPDNPKTNNITATVAAVLSAGGTIGTGNNGVEVNVSNGTITVSASGTDSTAPAIGPTSVNINGSSADGLLHFGDYPPGMVLFNGKYIGQILVSGVNPSAYSTTLADAQQTASTSNDNPVLPATTSTAGSAMGTAYPTDSPNAQNYFGGGVIGMLNPIVKVSGAGMALPEGMSGDLLLDDGQHRRR